MNFADHLRIARQFLTGRRESAQKTDVTITPQVGQRWRLKGEASPWTGPRIVTVYAIAPGWVRYGFHGPDDKLWDAETDYFLFAYTPDTETR